MIACHEPRSHYTFSERADGAVRIIRPPWGSPMTWYSHQGLCRACDILSRTEIPTDWLWRDLAAQGQFALLTPPVAGAMVKSCGRRDQAACFFSPSVNVTPAITSWISSCLFNRRHRFCADSASLKTIARHALREPFPFVLR